MRAPTIINQIFESDPSFHVKKHTTAKIQFLFFRKIFASTDKTFIL